MADSKRGKHARPRTGWLDWFDTGRRAVQRLRRLPSIVTRERVPIGKERA